jgi:hypothetical protein
MAMMAPLLRPLLAEGDDAPPAESELKLAPDVRLGVDVGVDVGVDGRGGALIGTSASGADVGR